MKNIIFDIGMVLIYWNPDLVYKPYFNDDESAMHRFYDETSILLENAEIDRGRSFDESVAMLSARYPHYREPIQFWKDRWVDMLDGSLEGSVTILKALHQKGYPLFALTNFSNETFPMVKNQYDFFKCFRDIVVSGDVKAIKPDSKIYQILLERNQLDPHECIFIDDRVENVEAAQDLGMQGIQFKSPDQLMRALKTLEIDLA